MTGVISGCLFLSIRAAFPYDSRHTVPGHLAAMMAPWHALLLPRQSISIERRSW
jgi:hypothetical protein